MYILYFAILAIVLIYLRKYFKGGRTTRTSMKGKVIVITGSSDGIGKECAFNLLEDGASVVFACRDEKKTNKVIEEVKNLRNGNECYKRSYFIHLDLSSFKSVDKFITEFKNKFDCIDILMNNAGYTATTYKETNDGLEAMSQTNHFSHVKLSLGLLDYFNKKEGRIINVSSMAHEFSNYENTYKSHFSKAMGHDQYKDFFSVKNSWTVYGNTKLNNIYFTQYLTKLFNKDNKYSNMHAYCNHPGAVATGFLNVYSTDNILLKVVVPIFRYITLFFFKNVNDGAQTQLHLCYSNINNLKDGAYYSDCKLKKTADIARKEDIENYIMQETLKIIK